MYPIDQRVSFRLIAKKHVELLRNFGIEVIERNVRHFTHHHVGEVTIVHPMFYPLVSTPWKMKWLIKKAKYLIGFDVCDTDRISNLASFVANMFDLVSVPCKFCKNVYRFSGVITQIEVLPHGVDDVFFREHREPNDPDLKRIASYRGRKILFFLWHSGFRKGADIVADAFARIVKEFGNVYLIVKTSELIDPFTQFLMHIPNVIFFNKWLSEDDLVDLYDICDIVVVPSRGGGFELNALEGLARGKIVVVSQWGSFDDYCKECLRVTTKNLIDLFMGDCQAKMIHSGKGVNPDSFDLYQKLKYALQMYDVLLKRFKVLQRVVRENYNWKTIGKQLYDMVRPFLE